MTVDRAYWMGVASGFVSGVFVSISVVLFLVAFLL